MDKFFNLKIDSANYVTWEIIYAGIRGKSSENKLTNMRNSQNTSFSDHVSVVILNQWYNSFSTVCNMTPFGEKKFFAPSASPRTQVITFGPYLNQNRRAAN